MRRVSFWMIILWSVLGVIGVSAQAVPPIFAIANAQLLRQEGAGMQGYAACQPPNEGLLSTLIISPDNRYLLMETQPEMVRQAILIYGGIGGGPLPSNLWMCDTQANTLTIIGSQPADASFMAGDIPDKATIRSAPVWSPDGAQVAWIEQTYPTISYSLMIFTIAQNTIIQVPIQGLPEPVGVSAPYPVYWGDAGIMLDVISLDQTTFNAVETLYLFDNTGQFLRATLVGAAGENDDIINTTILVRYQDKQYMGLDYDRAGWVLLDVLTGEKQPMPGIPELYSRTAPTGLTLDATLDDQVGYVWHISGSDKPIEGLSRQRLSLSPDGSRAAYATDSIRIWADGQEITVSGSDDFADDPTASLVWSSLVWRVREGATAGVSAQDAPAATATVVDLSACTGLLTPRLQAGGQARVITSAPNNVRLDPTISAKKIGQLESGTTFDVVDGPVCADGYAWYRVRTSVLDGWTAEGGNDTYWLEPVQ